MNFPSTRPDQPSPSVAGERAAAGKPAPARHLPTLAANDPARPPLPARYDWDARGGGARVRLDRKPRRFPRWLPPVGGLVALAGVAAAVFVFADPFSDPRPALTADAAKVAAPAVRKEAPKPAPAVINATQLAAAEPPQAPQKTVAPAQAPVEANMGEASMGARAAPAVAMAPTAPAPAANMKVPPPDNARWGEVDEGPQVDTPDSAPVPSQSPKELAYAAPEQSDAADAAIAAVAPKRSVDRETTAAVPPAKATPAKATPPGVDPAYAGQPAKAGKASKPREAAKAVPAAEPVKSEAAPAGSGRKGVVRTAVKLHAGPGNGTRTIGVVPGKSTVDIISCDLWCKIAYDGRQGYIYKSFVTAAAALAAAAKPAAEKPQTTAENEAPSIIRHGGN